MNKRERAAPKPPSTAFGRKKVDFITVVRADTHEKAIVSLNSIVAFWDNIDKTGHISLVNQEFIETEQPIASELRRQITLMGNRVIKVGE